MYAIGMGGVWVSPMGVRTRDRGGGVQIENLGGAKSPFSEAYIIKINTFDPPWGCLAPPSS